MVSLQRSWGRLHLLSAVVLALLLVDSAHGGFLGDIVSHAKNAGKGLEKAYQAATKPVRDASNEAYKKTIRRPFNEVKQAVNDAVPDRVKYIYKDNIERRFRPSTDFMWDAITGRKPFSEAASDTVDAYVEQAKELLVPPELYVVYQSAKAISDPLPGDSLNIIAPHWAALTKRALHRSARYAVSAEIVDVLSAGGAAAITLYDIVLFREPLSDTPKGLALLAHEMVHVDQYHELSFMVFAAKYYIGGKLRTGRSNPLEKEAYELEERIYARLQHAPFATRSHRPDRGSASIGFVAAATAMGGRAQAVVPLAVSQAISRGDQREITDLATYAISAPGVPDDARSEACRLLASNAPLMASQRGKALDFALLAVYFDPSATINWYYLAMTANLVGDIKTEYEALVQLATMMIDQELESRSGQVLTPRLRGAEMHLNRAAALGQQLGWQQGFVFDTRLPFIMLVSIGLELRPNWFGDNAMLGYANQGLAISNAVRRYDRLHFSLLDVTTQADLRAGINMRNPMYLQRCMRHCFQARSEYERLGRKIEGVPDDFAARMTARANEARRYLTVR